MPKLLHEQLGAQYINDWFNDSLFTINGNIHRLRAVDRSDVDRNKYVVHTDSFDLASKNPRWARTKLPVEVLKDFTTFKYPKLGYRQFYQGKTGPIVVQASTVRAAYRGMRLSGVRWELLPAFKALQGTFEGFENVNDARLAKELFAPTFVPFSVGLSQLLRNEILGFAVSEDLAIGAACVNDGQEGYNVYFRGRVVGSVDEGGTLTLTNKILQRESVRKKLFK